MTHQEKIHEKPLTVNADGKTYKYYRQAGIFEIILPGKTVLVSSVTMASDRAIRGLAIEAVDVLQEASAHLLGELVQ